jgi:hypothetical protein
MFPGSIDWRELAGYRVQEWTQHGVLVVVITTVLFDVTSSDILHIPTVSSTGNGTCVENRVVYCATGTEIYISAG